jgi:adenylate cyclase
MSGPRATLTLAGSEQPGRLVLQPRNDESDAGRASRRTTVPTGKNDQQVPDPLRRVLVQSCVLLSRGSSTSSLSKMTHREATFAFADIAGFTALTEAHGDEAAFALVGDFARTVKAELPRVGGEHVKTIGDALMLCIPHPGDAILLGLEIANDLMVDHGAPAVRVGLHHGPAVESDGDYFGATVNLAARVSARASGGEVLVTGSTAALAPDLEGVLYESRGRQTLRNVAEPVEVFAALRLGETSEAGLPVDPVCRMLVDPERAAGRLVHEGETYFFCSLTCAGAFAQQPGAFRGRQ